MMAVNQVCVVGEKAVSETSVSKCVYNVCATGVCDICEAGMCVVGETGVCKMSVKHLCVGRR